MGDEGVEPRFVFLLVEVTASVVGKVTCDVAKRGQPGAQGSGQGDGRKKREPAGRGGSKTARGRAECGRSGGENGERDSQKRRRGTRETEAFSPRHELRE